jgi:uncharacterized protein (TIGR03067 family)
MILLVWAMRLCLLVLSSQPLVLNPKSILPMGPHQTHGPQSLVLSPKSIPLTPRHLELSTQHLGLSTWVDEARGPVFVLQPPQDPDMVLELGKLKGSWQISSISIDGKDATEGFRNLRFVFSGRSMTLTDQNGKAFRRKEDGKVEERTFKLILSSVPKGIDMTILERHVSLGIYSLAGDELRLCTAEPGKPRPTAFQGGPGISLVVLKREKQQP